MSIHRSDWINAALGAFRSGGVNAVSVESVARELGLTKGSFYWHFSTRDELLEELLRVWETETDELVAAAARAEAPLDRVLEFFAVVARNRGQVPDIEYFSWARRDAAVAGRIAATESKRIAFIAKQLRDAGLDRDEAARRAEIGYLSAAGWLERATRTPGGGQVPGFRRFANELFGWLFQKTSGPKGRATARLDSRAMISGRNA